MPQALLIEPGHEPAQLPFLDWEGGASPDTAELSIGFDPRGVCPARGRGYAVLEQVVHSLVQLVFDQSGCRRTSMSRSWPGIAVGCLAACGKDDSQVSAFPLDMASAQMLSTPLMWVATR